MLRPNPAKVATRYLVASGIPTLKVSSERYHAIFTLSLPVLVKTEEGFEHEVDSLWRYLETNPRVGSWEIEIKHVGIHRGELSVTVQVSGFLPITDEASDRIIPSLKENLAKDLVFLIRTDPKSKEIFGSHPGIIEVDGPL